MDVVANVASVRAAVSRWRKRGERVALVPTMGNLHAGHHALVDQARTLADRVVASVFVNPTQFGPNEDLARYPRTPQDDAEGLAAHACDLMFMPDVDTIYPFGSAHAYRVTVPALADVLCGAHRPGHFDGVATVVSRLFTLVAPDVAVFGEKDFQQLRIIERMTVDLGFDIAIVRSATVREADGLAMSSRNRYLDPGQRARAPAIRASLLAMADGWRSGETASVLETAAHHRLSGAGFDVDYVEIRDEARLGRPDGGKRDGFRAFIAARIGPTRLIDNIALPDKTSSC
jgi:pantoate--beta-alanine ligase